MAGLPEFYCGSNEPSHASQFKWLEYTFKAFFGEKKKCHHKFLLCLPYKTWVQIQI
jgi:hypothetical protein